MSNASVLSNSNRLSPPVRTVTARALAVLAITGLLGATLNVTSANATSTKTTSVPQGFEIAPVSVLTVLKFPVLELPRRR